MTKSHEDVSNIKEDEERIRNEIGNLKGEISNLNRLAEQSCELEEDKELR